MKNQTKDSPEINPRQTDILTDAEVALLLQIEPRTLRLWRNTRGLPFLRITPKVIRYRRSDIEAWLNGVRTVIK